MNWVLFPSYGSGFAANDFSNLGDGCGNPQAADQDRPPWTEGGVGRGWEGKGYWAGIGTPCIIGVMLSRSGGGRGSPVGDDSKNALFSSVYCPKWVTHIWRPGIASIGIGAGVADVWGGGYYAWGWARQRLLKPAAAAWDWRFRKLPGVMGTVVVGLSYGCDILFRD